MKKIIIILIIFSFALPSFGYKIVKRSIPSQYYYPNTRYYSYNYPYGYYNNPSMYRFSPMRKIKNYFIGTPTGWTNTPYYPNKENMRNFFNDNGGNSYYYDDGRYYTQNREVTGGGSVTIIND